MGRLLATDAGAEIALATNAAALPFPPANGGVGNVPVGWTIDSYKIIANFDLSIWSTGSLSLTNAELFGGVPRALAQAGQAMTSVDSTTDQITKNAHGYLTGDGPVQLTTSGTVPAGLALATDYYVITVDANTIKLATSRANALAGTAIDITSNGTGTQTLTGTAACARVYWHSYGTLPTPIALTNQRAYSVRCAHRPRTIAYAVVGTLSAGAVWVVIEPVTEN